MTLELTALGALALLWLISTVVLWSKLDAHGHADLASSADVDAGLGAALKYADRKIADAGDALGTRIADLTKTVVAQGDRLALLKQGVDRHEHPFDARGALNNHAHDGYAPGGHAHKEYADKGHPHDGYADRGHDHGGAYAEPNHDHGKYAVSAHGHPLEQHEHGIPDHEHDGAYARGTHDHGQYAEVAHEHGADHQHLMEEKSRQVQRGGKQRIVMGCTVDSCRHNVVEYQ